MTSILDKILDIENLDKNIDVIIDFFEKGGSLQKAIGLSEEEVKQRYTYAYHLFEQHQYKDALEIFSYLAALNPAAKYLWLAMASTQVRMGDLEGALKNYALLTLLDPADPEPYYYAAFCHSDLQQRDDLIKALHLTLEAARKFSSHHPLEEKALLWLRQLGASAP